jgi:hypothetical protein
MLVNEGGASPQNDSSTSTRRRVCNKVINQVSLSITILLFLIFFFIFFYFIIFFIPQTVEHRPSRATLAGSMQSFGYSKEVITEDGRRAMGDRELMGDPSSRFNWS